MKNKDFEFIQNLGFIEDSTFSPTFPEKELRIFHKRIITDVYCYNNEKPPVLKLSYSRIMIHGRDTEFYSLSIKGAKKTEKGEFWVNYEAYSLSFDDITNNYHAISESLIAAWES